MLSLRKRVQELAQELTPFADLSDKPTRDYRAMPMRDQAEPMAAPDATSIEDHAPPLAPAEDDAGKEQSNYQQDDAAPRPREMPPMPRFLDRQGRPPAATKSSPSADLLRDAADDQMNFEEDADAADRSSGRPDDEWEGSNTRWD
jgi:hypothetical protein